MNYYIKTVVSVALIIVSISSCHGQHTGAGNHPVECVKLNNEGLNELQNYPLNGEKGLNNAIALFKRAIQCDSTNVVYFINLADAYGQKHNYNGSMSAYKKILKLTANDPIILMHKGMLFEVMNRIDSAKETYRLAQTAYSERLSKDSNNIQLIKGMILLKVVMEGKDEAIKMLNEQIKTHRELSSELSQELIFYRDFNRHNFIFGLPTVTALKN